MMESRRKLLRGAGLALFIAACGNSASAVAGQQPGSSDPFAGRWAGRLEGHGTAVITRAADGYSVVLEVETSPSPGSRILPCMGGIEGNAQVEGEQLVLTQTQNGATCRIIMRRSDSSLLVEVADFGCGSFHGISCGFQGTLQRVNAPSGNPPARVPGANGPQAQRTDIAGAMAAGATVPAREREPAPFGTKFPPVTVTVLGKTFRLIPVQMERPSRPWHEVSQHMPEELKATPPRPLSGETILERVAELRRARGQHISMDIDRIADRHLADFLREEPKANRGWFSLELAAACYRGDSMGYISPATLKACGEYLALENLVEMLRHALGKPSDYY